MHTVLFLVLSVFGIVNVVNGIGGGDEHDDEHDDEDDVTHFTLFMSYVIFVILHSSVQFCTVHTPLLTIFYNLRVLQIMVFPSVKNLIFVTIAIIIC